MPSERSWNTMDAQTRTSMATLKAVNIPAVPGVYALYRDGDRVYIGKAKSLRNRIWKNHSARGEVMTGSAMRRNIAEHLGIGSAADIKSRRYQPTPAEVSVTREWLDGCEIAWLECESGGQAEALEDKLKIEFRPPLTKR